jgi:Protein of unknown function (DUF1236)
MRRNLSITTAAAALLIGTVFAAAQGVQQRPGGEGGAQQGQGGTQVAPQQDKGKAQTKEPRTQGQGGQTQGQQGQTAPEPKGKAQSKEPKEPGTRGQGGQRETQGQREGQPQQQQGQQPQPKQQPQQGQQTPRDTEKTQKGAETKGGAQTDVKLTSEQRTKIRTTVLQGGNAPRVTNVNFSVTVGTVVPRDRVKVVAVPATLVEIHPAWRGYMYFIVDDRIIIVEPSSYKIVAVLVV